MPANTPPNRVPVVAGLDLGTENAKIFLAGLDGREVTCHLSKQTPEVCSHVRILKTISRPDYNSHFINFGNLRNPREYWHLRFWKKYIGATIDDVDLGNVCEEFGGLEIVADGSDEEYMALRVNHHVMITPHELLCHFFRFVKDKVPQSHFVQRLVLTVPVAANNRLRQKYIQAARGVFGLDASHVHLVAEPLAGLYSRLKGLGELQGVGGRQEEGRTRGERAAAVADRVMLVMDVGAGTTDLVLLRGGRVLAWHGDNFCGGSDVDLLMLNSVLEEVLKEGLDKIPLLMEYLRQAKEELCQQLTRNPDAPLNQIQPFCDEDRFGGRVEVTATHVITAAAPLRQPLKQAIEHVLELAGIQPGDVSRLFGMGGSFDLPCVADAISDVFGNRVEIIPGAGPAAREAVQGAVDLVLEQLAAQAAGRGGASSSSRAPQPGLAAALGRELPTPETFYADLPIGQAIFWRRMVQLENEWEYWLKLEELQDIKRNLLSKGAKRQREEALLQKCIEARQQGQAVVPKAAMEKEVEMLQMLVPADSRAPGTFAVPAELISTGGTTVFQLFQGVTGRAVYIGTCRLALASKQSFKAQVAVDENHCIGVELVRSDGTREHQTLSWDKVCAELSRAGHAQRTALLKPAAREFLASGRGAQGAAPAAAALRRPDRAGASSSRAAAAGAAAAAPAAPASAVPATLTTKASGKQAARASPAPIPGLPPQLTSAAANRQGARAAVAAVPGVPASQTSTAANRQGGWAMPAAATASQPRSPQQAPTTSLVAAQPRSLPAKLRQQPSRSRSPAPEAIAAAAAAAAAARNAEAAYAAAAQVAAAAGVAGRARTPPSGQAVSAKRARRD